MHEIARPGHLFLLLAPRPPAPPQGSAYKARLYPARGLIWGPPACPRLPARLPGVASSPHPTPPHTPHHTPPHPTHHPTPHTHTNFHPST